jgi:hypothetical protein
MPSTAHPFYQVLVLVFFEFWFSSGDQSDFDYEQGLKEPSIGALTVSPLRGLTFNAVSIFSLYFMIFCSVWLPCPSNLRCLEWMRLPNLLRGCFMHPWIEDLRHFGFGIRVFETVLWMSPFLALFFSVLFVSITGITEQRLLWWSLVETPSDPEMDICKSLFGHVLDFLDVLYCLTIVLSIVCPCQDTCCVFPHSKRIVIPRILSSIFKLLVLLLLLLHETISTSFPASSKVFGSALDGCG